MGNSTWLYSFLCFLLQYGFAYSQCPRDQSLALLQLKQYFVKATGAPYPCVGYGRGIGTLSHPKTMSWNSSTDCCTWDGVHCYGKRSGHVTDLSLDCSQLEGDIQSNSSIFYQAISQLVSLRVLSLAHNNLTGVLEIDTLQSSPVNLDIIDISYTNLSLTTSTNDYISTNPMWLFMGSCKIKVFPEFLRGMKNLILLDLSDNEIHGQFPPNWAGDIWKDSLLYLDLSHNFITGTQQLPWNRLRFLNLGSNLIQGPFPPSICSMSGLQILDLSNNSFGGVIPQCLGSYFLRNLNLNGNLLEGKVPRSLANCKNLEALDLGNNHLIDTFPDWLETLPLLQVVVLRYNGFYGPISRASEPMYPSLKIIDLSHNELTGLLPRTYFINFHGMRNVKENGDRLKFMGYYYHFKVAMKGQEFELVRVLITFITVDLSSNKFEGEIPEVIGSLNSLKVLNLSHNSFRGQIPQQLGNLSAIESLDLSWNQLVGEIPHQLTALTFLEVLNLSQNHLVGRIPLGKQFNTFGSDSYMGNPALYGFPLPDSHLPSSPQGENSDNAGGFTWKVVLLGYGCGTLLGLVMGYFMFLTGRPKWFTEIVQAEEHRIVKRQIKRNHIHGGRRN